MNPQMFNSFLDGTKSAIEMAAITNATALGVPADGLGFPPCGVDDLPRVLRGRSAGGVLERDGMVEVVSSLERDGRAVPRDLRSVVRRARGGKGPTGRGSAIGSAPNAVPGPSSMECTPPSTASALPVTYEESMSFAGHRSHYRLRKQVVESPRAPRGAAA
jgi:hypothetical protein